MNVLPKELDGKFVITADLSVGLFLMFESLLELTSVVIGPPCPSLRYTA